MNKKILIAGSVLIMITLVIIFITVFNKYDKSYEEFLKDSYITVNEELSDNIIKDDCELVKKYFADKGISGTLYSYDLKGEGVPEEVYAYGIEPYYVLTSNGMPYFAIVVENEVIEINRK